MNDVASSGKRQRSRPSGWVHARLAPARPRSATNEAVVFNKPPLRTRRTSRPAPSRTGGGQSSRRRCHRAPRGRDPLQRRGGHRCLGSAPIQPSPPRPTAVREQCGNATTHPRPPRANGNASSEREKRRKCGAFPRALQRTRTVDPLLTIRQPMRNAKARAAARAPRSQHPSASQRRTRPHRLTPVPTLMFPQRSRSPTDWGEPPAGRIHRASVPTERPQGSTNQTAGTRRRRRVPSVDTFVDPKGDSVAEVAGAWLQKLPRRRRWLVS